MKRKFTILLSILIFSLLSSLTSFNTVSKEVNQTTDIIQFDSVESLAPVITIDLKNFKNGKFEGSINDTTKGLLQAQIAVNNDYSVIAPNYVEDYYAEFNINSSDVFIADQGISNNLTFVVRSWNFSIDHGDSFQELDLGPVFNMNCLFCDNRDCWSGGPLPLNVNAATSAQYPKLTTDDTSSPKFSTKHMILKIMLTKLKEIQMRKKIS
jgi:hypothetical protein